MKEMRKCKIKLQILTIQYKNLSLFQVIWTNLHYMVDVTSSKEKNGSLTTGSMELIENIVEGKAFMNKKIIKQ